MRLGSVETTSRDTRSSSLLITLGTAGALAFSLAIPVRLLALMITSSLEPGRLAYAALGFALCLPLQVWLVLSATRGPGGRRERLALAALAAIVAAILPLAGTFWLGAVWILGGLVLVHLRRPWSWILVAVMAVAEFPLAFAIGHPEWGLYFALAVPYNAVPLAVGVWFTRAARQVQAARVALAEEAIVRERVRIEGEVRQTVGPALEAIAAAGDRTAGQLAAQPVVAARGLRMLVSTARATLADARRLVIRYRGVSLRGELETAVTLLDAAGIRAELELPPGGLPAAVDEEQRAGLRRAVTRLLQDGTAAAGVAIGVAEQGGRTVIELRAIADEEARAPA